jgi:hypothetical protein
MRAGTPTGEDGIVNAEVEIANIVLACPGGPTERYEGGTLALFYSGLLGMRIIREDWFTIAKDDEPGTLRLAFGDGPTEKCARRPRIAPELYVGFDAIAYRASPRSSPRKSDHWRAYCSPTRLSSVLLTESNPAAQVWSPTMPSALSPCHR